MLFLNADGTVKAHGKISDTQGGFTGTLDNEDIFGGEVVALGDLDGDGVGDLAVGATGDDDGGAEGIFGAGAVWVLFLEGPVAVPTLGTWGILVAVGTLLGAGAAIGRRRAPSVGPWSA